MSSESAPGGRQASSMIVAVILVIIGILAAVAGIFYLAKTSESLPSFLPGRRAGNTGHDTVRGIAAIVVAVAAFAVAGVVAGRGRRQQAPQA